MSKLTPKEIMEIETQNLIKTVTDIDEDEENFEICERFCLSNILLLSIDRLNVCQVYRFLSLRDQTSVSLAQRG